METFTYFPLLPRDIQLIIWELYEASPVGIRHHLVIGHRQIAYAAINPSHDNTLIPNAASEDDPAEIRLDPFCKHKFTKIKLAVPAFSAPPGASNVSSWARLGDNWPATERPSYMYTDLERDVFFVDMTRDKKQLDPRVSCLQLYPAVSWMPEALSQARHVAVAANCGKLQETFRQLGEFPNLTKVYIVFDWRRHYVESPNRHKKFYEESFLQRMRELPRDRFGFVHYDTFAKAFSSKTDVRMVRKLFGISNIMVGNFFSFSFYEIRDGIEKIPVIDGRFDVEF